jgi:hypothetical protein
MNEGDLAASDVAETFVSSDCEVAPSSKDCNTRREKKKLKKKKQKAESKAESDFTLLVENRFNVLNTLLCEGEIDQATQLEVQRKGDEVDQMACSMLII